MNKIRVIDRPCPIEQTIVDHKFAIWRDPSRLRGGDIGAYYGGGGKLVCKVDSPSARASADIEKLEAVGRANWRQRELVVSNHQLDIV